jgi:hypothetical protein
MQMAGRNNRNLRFHLYRLDSFPINKKKKRKWLSSKIRIKYARNILDVICSVLLCLKKTTHKFCKKNCEKCEAIYYEKAGNVTGWKILYPLNLKSTILI